MPRRCARFGDSQRRLVLYPPAKRVFCCLSDLRVSCAIAKGSLTPAEASILRGQRIGQQHYQQDVGRIGLHFLETRQYQSHSESSLLDMVDAQAMEFLSCPFSEGLAAPFLSCCLDASHTVGIITRLGRVPFTSRFELCKTGRLYTQSWHRGFCSPSLVWQRKRYHFLCGQRSCRFCRG